MSYLTVFFAFILLLFSYSVTIYLEWTSGLIESELTVIKNRSSCYPPKLFHWPKNGRFFFLSLLLKLIVTHVIQSMITTFILSFSDAHLSFQIPVSFLSLRRITTKFLTFPLILHCLCTFYIRQIASFKSVQSTRVKNIHAFPLFFFLCFFFVFL